MSYVFVPARIDAGAAKGPRLGLLFHMAEGTGTVGYLSGTITRTRNPRKVSVHGVIETSGRFVRMLDWDHMHTSLNPDNRADADKGYFGSDHLKAVLGDWAIAGKTLGPNHATLAVEIEGFAGDGPNLRQISTAVAWGLDMKAEFASLRGALGHADQTDTKACPGSSPDMRAIFDGVGGHGLWTQEVNMPGLTITDIVAAPGRVSVKAGLTGVLAIQVDDPTQRFGIAGGADKPTIGLGRLVGDPLGKDSAQFGDRHTVRLIAGDPGVELAVMLDDQVDFDPTDAPADQAAIDAAVNLALDHVAGPATAIQTAIKEARPA